MICCEKCAFLYLKKIHTKNAEEGVCGMYERYGCKKKRMNLSGIVARKDLRKQGCGAFRQEGTVLVPGDCFNIISDNTISYVYLGTVGKYYKKRLLYVPGSSIGKYKIVDDNFLTGKKIRVYDFLPEYARKRKGQYFEHLKEGKYDD